ncbi:MAG: adenine phosphoribosyltransferase [bacterium]|nr:adenine phosphoribosyltransferase [bacterium]MDE0288371.1 adenine phosphoribosyltransferase [bacterium]MDE0438699.1 adenine phosphoribosyltransferase [bacterium]
MSPAQLSALVRDIPGFPTPEVVFKDITPVLADAAALRAAVELIAAPFRSAGVTTVAGIEARGFVLAPPVALELGAGFVPLRKQGKLPYHTRRDEYELEYGTDVLEIHEDAAGPDDRVLLVDDVIATGGTAGAAVRLIRGLGAELVGVAVLIELAFLNGRDSLDDVDLHAVVTYA